MTPPKPVPHLDLDAEESEPQCTFTIAGRTWSVRRSTDLAWATIEMFLARAEEGGDETPIQIGPFFEQMLVPEDVDAFMALLNDPRGPLSVSKVGPLVQYISEQVFERPTERPSASSSGPSAGGATSKARSSSRATTRKASAA